MSKDPIVFVVDDDTFMRDFLELVFAHARIPVGSFTSALDLLLHAGLGSRCVLLLGGEMPELSGIELQAILRERGIEVPIIVLSASAEVPMAVTAISDGTIDFIEKPFHDDALVLRVRQTIDRFDAPADEVPDSTLSMRLESLTPRETEVLELLVTGATNKRIARVLGGSFRTIEIHRARVMSKMGATTLAELVRMNIEAQREL